MATGIASIYHIPGEINPADILSKHWGYSQVWNIKRVTPWILLIMIHQLLLHPVSNSLPAVFIHSSSIITYSFKEYQAHITITYY
jgi:hypothetical protein